MNELIFISDIHGYDSQLFVDNLEQLKKDFPKVEDVIILGDIDTTAFGMIGRIFKGYNLYGVLGNHDTAGDLEYYGVKNLHGKVSCISGYNIGGIEGAPYTLRNKKGIFIKESDVECFLKRFADIDILISHSNSSAVKGLNAHHMGFKSITKFLKHNRSCKYHFFGHLHKNKIYKSCDLLMINIFGLAVFDFEETKLHIYQHM